MKARIVAAWVLGALAGPAAAQADAPTANPVPPPSAPTVAPQVLARDTPVHLMVLNEVTTKTHPAGHRFALRVDQPVMLGERIVIPVGARAWGEVTRADSSGNVGKPGSLNAHLLYVEVDDRQLPITGETAARGKGGGAETVIGVLALGPLGLFAKGNNAKIKAGERMTAFTASDFMLASPTPAATTLSPAP